MKIPNDISDLTKNAILKTDAKREKKASEDMDAIPFKKTRTKMLTLRVSEGEKIAIKHMAKVNDTDVSSYVRWLVKKDAQAKREVNRIRREG